MPIQFVPVPVLALDAVEPECWLGVVDLYKRAHALRWKPMTVTERSLKTRWRLGNSRVWSTLRVLEELGLLRIEHGKARRDPTRLHVFCPTRQAQAQSGAQHDAGEQGMKAPQQGKPQGKGPGASSETRDGEGETNSEPPKPPASGGPVLDALIEDCISMNDEEAALKTIAHSPLVAAGHIMGWLKDRGHNYRQRVVADALRRALERRE